MSEITLVTAFFDIGRQNWPGFTRGNDSYIRNFDHWARLKNNLIIYTFPEVVDKIREIREKYGLADRTTIISIPDVTQLDPELYQRLKYVMKKKDSWLFHKRLKNPESWNYRYNYIIALKSFFVADAVKRGLAHGLAAWIDFGYDHGGQEFPYTEDFDFTWQYNFSPSIHIFLTKPIDETPIFQIVHTMDTYIRGGIIVAPDYLWSDFWSDIRNAAFVLSDCGLADDDQTLMLMAYQKNPAQFTTHMTSYWGEPLRAYGGEKIRLRPQKVKDPNRIDRRFKRYLKQKSQDWDIKKRHGQEIENLFYRDK